MSRYLLVSALVACQSDPETTPTGTEPTAPDLSAYPTGSYLLGMTIVPVGGLQVLFQLDVAVGSGDAGPEFTTFEVRAVDDAYGVSDVLTAKEGIAVDLATGFEAKLKEFEIPAAFSITGSAIAVKPTLTADTVSTDRMCGDVTGEIVTLGIDLAGSTFVAIPWNDREGGVPSECEATTVEEVPRIESCPQLVDGMNTGFVSGGLDRTFEIVLPSDYDAGTEYPLIVVYHGFGGTIGSMLDAAGLRPYADSLDVILAVPAGSDLGGTPGWDAFSDPRTNVDLVLFDDLVTCARESFSVDANRIHVTGMSYGGLETGYVMAHRSDVVASAAPMSGGIGVPLVDTGYAMPALVIWGGPSDFAFEQDFDLLSNEMIETLLTDGSFVVACDHGSGHELHADFWPWTLEFLLDHPRGLASEPYAAALPPSFPAYCSIL